MALTYRFPNAGSPTSEASLLRNRTYSPGFSDELGSRFLAHGTASDPVLEVLQFTPELGDSPDFERALRARVQALRDVSQASLAVVHGVERPEGMGLCLITEHIKGRRVSELPMADMSQAFALDLIRTVTPAIEGLNQSGVGVAHGALSGNRVIVAADGTLVVVEHVLGWALEALRFSRTRLNGYGIVVANTFEPARFDGRTDMMQLGFLVLSILLRRRLDPADCPGKVQELLDEAVPVDGSSTSAIKMRAWVERALQIGSRPFTSAQEGVDAFDELPGESSPEARAASEHAARASHAPDAFDELSDEKDLQRAESPAAVLSFPTEIPVVPEVRRPAPQPEPATFDVANLRATLEKRHANNETPDASRRRLSRIPEWIFAAVSLIAVGEAVALMFMANDRNPADATNNPAPSAQVAGVSPPLPEPVSTNRPALLPRPSTTPVVTAPAPTPASTPIATPASPRATVPGRPGQVTITSAIPLQVFADGALVGSTTGPISLRPGTHNLRVLNAALGFSQTQTVTVRDGQPTAVSIAIPNGRISLNATPWAEVAIDGVVVGETPMGNYSLPIGSHEVVFRHPQLGERTQTVVVKAGSIARVYQEFRR